MTAALAGTAALLLPGTGYAAASPFAGSTAQEMAQEMAAQEAAAQGQEAADGGTDILLEGNGPAVDGNIGAPAYKEVEISKELLNDNVLEYGEISARIENYNVDYRNAKTQILNGVLSLDAAREMSAEASELMEDARDLWDKDMDEEDRALYESYKAAVKELRKQAQEATNADLPSYYERSLRLAKRNLTRLAENYLIGYQSAESQIAVAEKNVEYARAKLESMQRKAELGEASSGDVLAAKETLLGAESSAQQARGGLESVRRSLLVLLGWEQDAAVTFAPIGDPDESRLAAMDLEADKKAAVGANTSLYTIRSTGATGASARASKKRTVALTEQTVASQMEQLYAQVLAKKQAYDAANSQYAAAQQSKAGTDRMYSMGMIGKLDYLGAELSFLNASAAHTGAKLDLFKAMEDYDWAVHGMLSIGS